MKSVLRLSRHQTCPCPVESSGQPARLTGRVNALRHDLYQFSRFFDRCFPVLPYVLRSLARFADASSCLGVLGFIYRR